MKIEIPFHIILICFCFLTACNSKPTSSAIESQVRLTLSADSSTVELHQVPPTILDYLRADSLGTKDWQSFFAVYRDTDDPELRDLQAPLEGEYFFRDRIIIFLPKSRFEKGESYFARFYSRKILANPMDIVMGEKVQSGSDMVQLVFER